MGKAHKPRAGSMQFWPRVRAKREYTRVRSWADSKDAKLLGFAGYKVGMTHVLAADNKKTSPTKGTNINIPVTIIECPPMKIVGVRFYNVVDGKLNPADQIMFNNNEELKRKISLPKKQDKKLDSFQEKLSEFSDMTLIVSTQPKKTGIGKKKPEVFEVAVGGSLEEKYNYAKENLDKEITINDVFGEGFYVDAKAVTKGKGYQGAVKRFGIGTRAAKSEKGIRAPGSLGGWIAQQHTMYRIAHAGKMGYHTRTEYNKLILKISENPEEVNPKGGFINYGVVKNPCIIIKGSVAGPKKRLIRLNLAIRPNEKSPIQVPDIKKISVESKQGN
jgi:large subunit ribosomal protein L3